MSKTSLRLWAAYMEEPIMVKVTDIFPHCDVKSLAISDSLKEAIQAWNDRYQSTYPPDSGFESPDAEAAHFRYGAELAVRLQTELGEAYSVEFRT